MTGPRSGPVSFDLQATQSVDQRHRGIPRYILELALALEAVAPELVGAYLINPDLALPEAAEQMVATGKVVSVDDVDWGRARLLHIGSPLEMNVPPHRQLPTGARRAGVPRTITFYDLIPYLMPEHYLEDPGLRRRYMARLQQVRTAAAVLTLSEATRRDVVEHLGLDPRRVFTVGTGTSAHFVPPADRSVAAASAVAAVAGLRAPYVFYIGSYERRKNLEPLLEAWAQVPEAIRDRWQLALCCPLKPLELRHLQFRGGQMGLRVFGATPDPAAADVCCTGFVPDDVLLTMHQGADLFVFPSLYEGYGLPVAEALAAGAPVLAADSSSLREIVGPEALFDATSVPAMAAALERGLTDEVLRTQLLARAGRPPTTWAEVAEATAAAWERLLSGSLDAGPKRPPRSDPRPRLALCGVVGDQLTDLAQALTTRMEVVAFVDRPSAVVPAVPAPIDGVTVHSLAALETVEEHGDAFDLVVYLLADEEAGAGVLGALRRRRDGIVVAGSARLPRLYAYAARTGALGTRLDQLIASIYGDSVDSGLGGGNVLSAAEARRRGLLFVRDVVASARRVWVATELDAELARLDAAPDHRDRIEVVDPAPASVAEAIVAQLAQPAAAT